MLIGVAAIIVFGALAYLIKTYFSRQSAEIARQTGVLNAQSKTLDTVHTLVNSRLSDALAEIRSLKTTLGIPLDEADKSSEA